MKLYLKFPDGFKLMKMDAGSDISLNFSHDNLDNPLDYVSEYAYNLKVPCCSENNKFFNNFLHLDSLIMAGRYTPTKSMAYVVMDNSGSLISTGTAYVRNISGGYYNLSLTGSMSRIFSKLLNSGWNDYNSDLEYCHLTDWLSKQKGTIGFSDAINVINKDVVYCSWMVPHPVFDWETLTTTRLLLQYGLARTNVTETQCWIASIVGFAPTAQGKLKGFENDKWMEIPSNSGYNAFVEMPLFSKKYDEESWKPIEVVKLDDGAVECQMCEYRSYYQQPFIYVFRLWQFYQQEFARITDGYTLRLDERWFNDQNPLLHNLVYMLPKLWDESNSDILLKTDMPDGTAIDTLPTATAQTSASTFLVPGVGSQVAVAPYAMMRNKRSNKITYEFTVNVRIEPNQSIPSGATLYHSPCNILLLVVSIRDDRNLYNGYPATMANHRYALVMLPDDGTIKIEDVKNDPIGSTALSGAMKQGYKLVECKYTPGDSVWYVITFTDTLSAINTRSSFAADTSEAHTRLDANIRYLSNNTPWRYRKNGTDTYTYDGRGVITLELSNVSAVYSEATRTEKALTLGNLFRDEKPFSVLLKYSKLMHLVWRVDDAAKTVTVMRSADYYADIVSGGEGITDIGNLINLSKGMELEPLSWTDNKILLNFDDSDLDYISEYSRKYGQTYGSKTIITTNEIKSSSKKLLCTGEGDTVKPSVILSENVVPQSQMRNATSDEFGYVENIPMPLNMQDGESADMHGNFYFRLTNGDWDSRLAADGYVYITDDLDAESDLGRWMWHGDVALGNFHQASWIRCYVMPRFDTTSLDGSVSIHLAAVRELFSDYHNEPTGYLYEAVWRDYIEEVYNEQNKTVTLYAHIDKTLFDTLRRNPFVRIANCLYLLSSVEGWGEHAAVCKLKLRQIYNLDRLTGGARLEAADTWYILTEDEGEIITDDDNNLIQEHI